MQELNEGVNWLAVIIGAIAAYMLGWLWYSPKLFAEKWMTGAKVTFKEGDPMPVAAMIIQAIGTALLACVIGLISALGTFILGCLVIAMVAVLMMSGGLYSQKTSYAIMTEVGYFLAMVGVMVICQVLL